jgi:hypothetical protein
VSAETQLGDLFVGKVLNQLQQTRIRTEQVLPNIGSGLDGVLLPLAVDDFAMRLTSTPSDPQRGESPTIVPR